MKRLFLALILAGAGVASWAVFSREAGSRSDEQPTSPKANDGNESDGAHSAPATASSRGSEPIRVDATPPRKPPKPIAISSAAPTMTLAGNLESQFKGVARGKRWRGDPNEVKRSPGASQVAASKQFNPEEKQMSIEQERQLQEMIDGFDERSRPIDANERKGTIEALARAAAAGQFESFEVGIRPGMDAVALNRQTEEAGRKVREAQQRLADRFGMDGIDWGWATTPSSPDLDGVARQNIVYFLRVAEPDVFHLRDVSRAITRERHEAYGAFFDRLH